MMEIISGTTDFYIERPTAVAIGKFDGVHIGHRRLIEDILAQKQRGLVPCVFTFDPSPMVYFGKGDVKELSTIEERRALLERTGVEMLVEYPFNEQTAATAPDIFIRDVLVQRMGMNLIAAGEDVSYGAGGRGGIDLLKEYAKKGDYDVHVIPKVNTELDGEEKTVSSSLIRSLIGEGRIKDAVSLLGVGYPVFGEVEHGRHLGHDLGFPTVNITPCKGKLLPPDGVYLSELRLGRESYRSLTNIGTNPTVEGRTDRRVETYIYDFDKNIYGENVEVYITDFVRHEKKFANLDELKAQLARDIAENKC